MLNDLISAVTALALIAGLALTVMSAIFLTLTQEKLFAWLMIMGVADLIVCCTILSWVVP
jgi:heme O synthase-like polyprenyltransferase